MGVNKMCEASPIPVIRARYVTLIMRELSKRGVDGGSMLRQFGLPSNFEMQPDSYLALNAVHSLVRWADLQIGESVVMDAWSALTIDDFSQPLRAALCEVSTLGEALQQLARFGPQECSVNGYRAHREPHGSHVRVDYQSLFPQEKHACMELLQVFSTAAIVRSYLGEGWQPAQIFLRQTEDGDSSGMLKCYREHYANTQTCIGQPAAGLRFPVSPADLQGATAPGCSMFDTLPCRPIQFDFPTSLKVLLRPYLECENLEIKLVAEVAGISVRTLQRRLQAHSRSYTELLQQARLAMAAELLSFPEYKVIDTAYAVGYSDPSHFARAFRRQSGMTPRQFRTRCLKGESHTNWREMAGNRMALVG